MLHKNCNEIREEIRQQFHRVNFYGIYNDCPVNDEIDKNHRY